MLRHSFPELFDGEDIVPGAAQALTADVVDPGLRDALGHTVELKFDLTGWKPARFASRQGAPSTSAASIAPKAADGSRRRCWSRSPSSRGRSSSPRSTTRRSTASSRPSCCKFLVFAAVTAKETAEAQKTMVSGGFSPQKQNLLSASPDAPAVTQTYSNTKRRRLRFALSFSNQGAVLRLTVRGPDDKTYEQEGPSTFTIDVPDAAPGDWSYTVTAEKVPYANFPFTMTVGGD